MERLTFINSRGERITFDTKEYRLLKLSGTGAIETDIQTQKSPFQDGRTYIDNTLEPRTISIEIGIFAANKEDLFRRRRKVSRIFNPKLGIGKLIYEYYVGTKEIEAISELAPVFATGIENETDTFQRTLLTMYCPNPFWRDTETSKAEVAIWRGAFEFPLEIPIETGIEMGFREPSLIVNIFNPGDVPCGMEIRFKALATVTNPSLFNINTRKYIKINKILEAGEVLTVTTHFANKRVETCKQGVTENAFNWIGLNSTFLQLDAGDNLFRYDAESGIESLEVDIYYTPMYLGV